VLVGTIFKRARIDTQKEKIGYAHEITQRVTEFTLCVILAAYVCR